MDRAEIKQQIKHWEGVIADNKLAIKGLTNQNKSIETIVKNLRALLGKEEKVEEVRSDEAFVEESQ